MTSLGKNPRKKTASYSEESMKKALIEVRENKISVREACRQYGIPKSTILDRIHGKTTDSKRKRGPDPVLKMEGEKKIVEWLINIAKCGFPVKKQELLDSVQKIIQDGNFPNKFKDGRPGQTWYTNFLKRNPEISFRTAEGINKARAQITEESIRYWFKGLENYLDEINQKDILNRPESIFNGDESGFALCPKTGKVLGPRGFRNLYQIKQGNEKDNLTVLVTFNANGDVCPPCVVFPYVRPPRALVESMPPDWCLGRSESGWMRGEVFFEYITNDFNNWLERNNIQKPVLLLVDGHKSHMSLMLSTVCEQMQIILYALPPNTTHILQPADVSVFAPLKASWKNTVRAFLTKPENLNSSVTKANFCNLFAETLQSTNLEQCIKNGFKRCGLYPFNPNAPDYTKCVLNTLENLSSRQMQTNEGTTRSDVATTKKVLKQIKPALRDKNVSLGVIMKELNIYRKTLPVDTNASEVTIETESECTNISTSLHVSAGVCQIPSNAGSVNFSNSLQMSAELQHVTKNVNLSADINNDNGPSDLNTLSSLHLTGSYLDVGTIISLDDVLVLPLDLTDRESKSSNPLNVPEKPTLTRTVDLQAPLSSTPIAIEEEEFAAFSQIVEPEILTRARTPDPSTSPIVTSNPITIEREDTSSNSLVVSETTMSLLSSHATTSTPKVINEQPEVPESLIMPAKNTLPKPLQLQEPSQTPSYLKDPFEDHLYLPNKPGKVITANKNKAPAAISSAAWRAHYEIKEQVKNIKQEETRKRKLERIEAKILKESNRKQKTAKIQTRRKKSQDTEFQPRKTQGVRKENYEAPSSTANKITCSKCEEDLISDVEDDEDKNIGCDLCPRWYHLKCTIFVGHAYMDIKDQPYKCEICL